MADNFIQVSNIPNTTSKNLNRIITRWDTSRGYGSVIGNNRKL